MFVSPNLIDFGRITGAVVLKELKQEFILSVLTFYFIEFVKTIKPMIVYNYSVIHNTLLLE